jgi:hypothetical protein
MRKNKPPEPFMILRISSSATSSRLPPYVGTAEHSLAKRYQYPSTK